MDIEFRKLRNPNAPTPEELYSRLASSEVLFDAAYGRMMLELLDVLRRAVVGPRLLAEIHLFGPGLRLLYSDGHGNRTAITVGVDYKDRSPVIEGLPLLHYRLKSDPWTSDRRIALQEELSTRDVHTACDFIHDAIKACQTGN